MFPLQFILLLVVASAPLQMDLLAGGVPSLPIRLPAWALFFSFFATQLLLVMFVWNRTRRAIRALHETPSGASQISQGADLLFNRARWTAMVITAMHLFCTPLATLVLAQTEQAHIIRWIPGLAETFFITPAVLAWLAIWTASYHMEMATQDRSLAYRLALQEPVHEMPTLGQFLGMQARHNFYPYALILIVGLFDKTGKYLERFNPQAPTVTSWVATVAVFVLLPFVLVRIWTTSPLDGPLRDRLDRVAAEYRLRFRNILLWRTHNLVPNAAILGWLPFGRYFLMSDSLVESFTDRQLEAVFAHEVGHGVHRHMPWFLAIFAGANALALGFGGLVAHVGVPGMSEAMAGVALYSVALLVIGGGAFYFVAPRFEHQADWFAARHMSKMVEEEEAPESLTAAVMTPVSPLPEELNWTLSTAPSPAETLSLEEYAAGQYPHAPGVTPVIRRATPHEAAPAKTPTNMVPLTPAQRGAEIFISALDSLVETLHRDRSRRDIMHPSIDDRVALLRTLTTDPAAELKFNRSMRRTRLVIVCLLAAGIGTAIVAAMVPETKPEGTATQLAPQSQTSPASRSTSSPASQATSKSSH